MGTLALRFLFAALLGLVSGLASGEVAVIVHPDSPVRTLTPREVSDLYLGRSRSIVVGEPQARRPAVVYEQPSDSPVRESFFRALNGMSVSQLNAYWARLRFSGEVLPPAVLSDSRAVVDLVSRDREAIGYVDASALNSSVRIVLRLRE